VRPKHRRGPQAVAPATQASPPLSRSALWISVGLIAAVLIVYTRVRQFGFVTWDDPQYVSENPHVLGGLGWQSIRWAFTKTDAGLWLPLTWLSFMLDVEVWGPGAGGHHVTNVVLHVANTLLLFGLLQRTTGALGRSAFVAALFAVHPLHVESVAWVTERKDVLSTFCGVLTLWAYVGYVKRPTVMRYVAVVAAFALGLMAKPMVVTLPFLLLLMDVWPLGRLRLTEPTRRSVTAAVWGQRSVLMRLLREKIPLLVIALLSSVVTYVAQKGAGAVSVLEALPLDDRIRNALVSYVAYIAKMLWPSNLAGLYPYHPLSPAWVFGSAVLLVGITASVLLAATRYPYLLVGWFWYLGTLLPVIGLVQVGTQARADRFTYIPLIGLFIVIAWGASDLAARWPRRPAVLKTAAFVVVTACAVTARAQVGYWRDSLTFWQHTVDVTTDNARAHGNLGLVLADLGRASEAITHYTEAIRISPELADVHSNLGNALAGQGRTEDAVAHYREALRIDPNQLTAHNGLGSALDDQGRYAEAITHYRDALRIDPRSAMIHNNLGAALVNQEKLEEAVSHLIEAARLAPDDADFHYNAAAVLERLGRFAEAGRHLEDALRQRPSHAEARRLLEQLRASGRIAP
jgi:Flp pilus assembly protein TadD